MKLLKKGGKVKKKKPLSRFKKPKPGSYDYQLQQTMKPGAKDRKEMKKGGSALKPVDKKKNPGLAKLPKKVRNKMGYMKNGGVVRGKARGGGAATRGLGYNVKPN